MMARVRLVLGRAQLCLGSETAKVSKSLPLGQVTFFLPLAFPQLAELPLNLVDAHLDPVS